MFEHKQQELLPAKQFYFRMLKHSSFAAGLIIMSLFVGMLGYHFYESLNWVDSLVNASMILGGMGPVDPMKTTGGKIFASFYALFSGIIFLVIIGTLFAPIYHRFLHKFHLEFEEEDSGS